MTFVIEVIVSILQEKTMETLNKSIQGFKSASFKRNQCQALVSIF